MNKDYLPSEIGHTPFGSARSIEDLPEVKEMLTQRKETAREAYTTVYLVPPKDLTQEDLYQRILRLPPEKLQDFGVRSEEIIENAIRYDSENFEIWFIRDSINGYAIEIISEEPYLAKTEGERSSRILEDNLGIGFDLKKE